MPELGIVETRNIISIIAQKFSYDFSDYSLISFKRRLERIIEQNNIKFIEQLINKFNNDPSFFEEFIDQIGVPSTEMFRDPSLWRILREETIPQLLADNNSPFKIWLPNSVSGDEVYSLAIMLSEMDLLEKIPIIVSSLSNKSIDNILVGGFPQNKLEISTDNYVRANGKFELSKYYENINGAIVRDKNLLQNVTFVKQNTYLDPVQNGIKLILFRNKMIYYNQTLQTRVLKSIYNSLQPGGLLVVGTKESLNTLFSNSDFVLISKTESIYKRRV